MFDSDVSQCRDRKEFREICVCFSFARFAPFCGNFVFITFGVGRAGFFRG